MDIYLCEIEDLQGCDTVVTSDSLRPDNFLSVGRDTDGPARTSDDIRSLEKLIFHLVIVSPFTMLRYEVLNGSAGPPNDDGCVLSA